MVNSASLLAILQPLPPVKQIKIGDGTHLAAIAISTLQIGEGYNLGKRCAGAQTCKQPCFRWRYSLWIPMRLCPTSSYALQPANRSVHRSQDQ
jgi:hypothetical protein